MDKRLNELITKKILSKLPNNIKIIDYLKDILGIGKESAYRRVRSDIPFTFEEITKIAVDLGISIDEVIGWNIRERVFFDFDSRKLVQADESFYQMLCDYNKQLNIFCEKSDIEIAITVNKIISLFAIASGSDLIFKYYYYRWLNIGNNLRDVKFSEVIVPEKLTKIKKEVKKKIDYINNITIIIDRHTIENTIREIQYYFTRKLISSEEVAQLKAELSSFMNFTERMLIKGDNLQGKKYFIYISLLSVASNSIYCRYDKNYISQYWIYENNSIAIMSEDMCVLHKKWIDSLKKSSALISQSNEILQSAFLTKQKEIIENITNELYYYG
jgi:hypothetical protein